MQLRQGDILIERLEVLPGELAQADDTSGSSTLRVAEGERTGHAHELVAETAFHFAAAPVAATGESLVIGEVMLATPARLVHPEHAPLALEPGLWRFTRQRRFDPKGHSRLVVD